MGRSRGRRVKVGEEKGGGKEGLEMRGIGEIN
jgi:hypothetical protein